MGDKTKIEWTDSSWTAIRARNLRTGKIGWHCEHVTPGCEHCYSETLNKVYGTKLPFKPGHRKDVEIFLDEKMLTTPLRWKKPRMVFVCSMTDLFADFVKDEWIDRVFAVMALCPQHKFQVLTKRPERMRSYMTSANDEKLGLPKGEGERRDHICVNAFALNSALSEGKSENAFTDEECLVNAERWPLSNVWLGISAEDQATADERIPLLLDTPAAIRFVSFEPLLGPTNLHVGIVNLAKVLDWTIIGGESGKGARPFDLGWARSLVAQCKAADLKCFVKQLGAKPVTDHRTRPAGENSFVLLRDKKGGDWSEWPEDLRVREFPESPPSLAQGKAAA